MNVFIGTAGWTIPATEAGLFPASGTSLERYSARFAAVEINSSFHRPHRAATWARWGESVPAGFRFSVKVPKTITHQRKLVGCDDLADAFLADVAPLGDKLAILLVQLPPKLGFDPAVAEHFFGRLAGSTGAAIACEPRHPDWFEDSAGALLARLGIARVAADPAVVPAAALPGGSTGLSYFRLHGSPQIYRSAYGEERIEAYAGQVRDRASQGGQVWCMFDNTAASAATADALALMERL